MLYQEQVIAIPNHPTLQGAHEKDRWPFRPLTRHGAHEKYQSYCHTKPPHTSCRAHEKYQNYCHTEPPHTSCRAHEKYQNYCHTKPPHTSCRAHETYQNYCHTKRTGGHSACDITSQKQMKKLKFLYWKMKRNSLTRFSRLSNAFNVSGMSAACLFCLIDVFIEFVGENVMSGTLHM